MSFSGKYIAKMYNLKSIFKLSFFVRVVRNQKQGYVSRKCIPWYIWEQIGIDMLYLHIFLITMHEIDTAAEVDLEPFQTYMIEIFCENGYSFCLLTRI